MLTGPPEGFRWPEPWQPLGPTEALSETIVPSPDAPASQGFTFEFEFQREVCLGHPLYRIECRAVARNRDHHDEFIFVTANPRMPIAFVHLTWVVESKPIYPYTAGYSSWADFHSVWAESEA